MRGMGTTARVTYFTLIGVCALLGILALVSGWWVYTVFAIAFGAIFAWTAPFVLGKGWAAPERPPTRRPVTKRRRR